MNSIGAGEIIVVGTLDTKGDEIAYVRHLLLDSGARPLVVDVGVLGSPPFAADVTREQIAAEAGRRIDTFSAGQDRGQAMALMEAGLVAWLQARLQVKPPLGILAIGGSAGTAIATAGMRQCPLGLPKLMVSTMASGNTRPYVGNSDICMMYSVADLAGLNRFTRLILSNAVNAILGMTGLRTAKPNQPTSARPLVAATMFGVTTPCVNRVKTLLESHGVDLMIFHATGSGGQAMEQLVRDGYFEGVLDITTTELADELAGGILAAGPERMEIAGRMRLPQVISVGALDMVNFGPPSTVPERCQGRLLYAHNSNITLMRTTADENSQLGRMIAGKASASKGSVTIVLPTGGVSAIDAPGHIFYDPEADRALFDAIRAGVSSNVKVVEMDVHINDPEFAGRIVSEYIAIRGEREDAPNARAVPA